MVNLQDFPLVAFIPFPSKINPNPDLPAAFIPFFRRIFLMANAMKIHLKKNAAANGLELKERLQGLTATDVTHSPTLLNNKNIACLSTPDIRQGFQLPPICIVRWLRYAFTPTLPTSFHSFFLLFLHSFLSLV